MSCCRCGQALASRNLLRRIRAFCREYRCPAIDAAWHRSNGLDRKSTFDLRIIPSGLAGWPRQPAAKIGVSSVGFIGIRSREQFCCKADDIADDIAEILARHATGQVLRARASL